MEIIDTPSDHSKSEVLVVGTFDGIHRGHQHLINGAKQVARRREEPLGLMTFEPDPEMVLASVDPVDRRLLSRADKLSVLEELGVDYLHEIPFNEEFASLSAQQFIEQYLLDQRTLSHLCVGPDFRFGHDRSGSPDLLADHLEPEGIQVEVVDPLMASGEPISSTRIRQMLREGRSLEARRLLGRPYVTFETVVEGDGRGQEIGFPTVNFNLTRTIHPRYGVYSVWLEADRLYRGIANFGERPSVEQGQRSPVLEVHSLEEGPPLSPGDRTHVYWGEFIRDEVEFDSLDQLTDQINEDIDQARRSLDDRNRPEGLGNRSVPTGNT